MEPEFGQTEPSRVDEQGRTILPREVRQALGLVGQKGYIVFERRGEEILVYRATWAIR